MLNKSTKIGYATIALFSLFFSFFLLVEYNSTQIPGSDYTVQITESTPQAVNSNDIVEQVARATHSNIGREISDPLHPKSFRSLQLSVGNENLPSSRWLLEGYPDFSREITTTVIPWRDNPDFYPGGIYMVYGSHYAAEQLLQTFVDHGWVGYLEPTFDLGSELEYYGSGPMLLSFLLSIVVLMVIVTSGVVLNVKAYAIQRLQGRSFFTVFVGDLRQLFRPLVLSASLLTVLVVSGLWFYNSLNQFSTFAILAVIFSVLLFSVAVFTHSVVLFIVYRALLITALKGKMRTRWITCGLYSARLASAVLVVLVLVSALHSLLDLRSSSQKMKERVGADSVSYLLIKGYSGTENEIDNTVGAWLRDTDIAGEAVLAERMMLRSQDKLHGIPILTINDAYLEMNPVVDNEGQPVIPSEDKNIVQILYPNGSVQEIDQVENFIKAQIKVSLPPDYDHSELKIIHQPIKEHQQLPLYDNPYGFSGDDTTKNSMIVLYQHGANYLSGSFYSWMFSSGKFTFKDQKKALSSAHDRGLDRFIYSVTTSYDLAWQNYRDALRAFQVIFYSLVIAVIAFLISSAGIAVAATRKRAQNIFSQYILGWPFWRRHYQIFIGETIFLLAPIIWYLYAFLEVQEDLNVGSNSLNITQAQILVKSDSVVGLVISGGVSVLGFLVFLFIFSRQVKILVRDRSTDSI
ncbi:MAG: hypothetical protein ACRCSF_09770 [Mycobacteriaceae bacterium]